MQGSRGSHSTGGGRADIHVALDIRSWERVVYIGERVSPTLISTPESWELVKSPSEASIDADCVVIVNTAISQRVLRLMVEQSSPRMIAFMFQTEQDMWHIRRSIAELYPFCDMWAFSTDFGKVLATTPKGTAYDRSSTVDMREAASA